MKRVLFAALAALGAQLGEARYIGLGVDAFNRAVPASVTGPAVFSPVSFEIDSVAFAEAVDPIRRSIFTDALHVMDELDAEYSPIARFPFEFPATNGVDLVWAHAFVTEEPRRIDATYRCHVQDAYGFEICRARPSAGIEAWVRTRFAGSFADWSLESLPKGEVYALEDLVSVTVTASVSNGWKRLLPTHTVCCQPLDGGANFYAVVPKKGRPVSSVRARVTSQTVAEIMSHVAAVIDPPVPVRLVLPAADLVATNDLTGAFSYFRFPLTALKPFPAALHPCRLRQTVRFRLKGAAAEARVPADAAAPERLEGPFLFFVHDPVLDTLPVIGIVTQ